MMHSTDSSCPSKVECPTANINFTTTAEILIRHLSLAFFGGFFQAPLSLLLGSQQLTGFREMTHAGLSLHRHTHTDTHTLTESCQSNNTRQPDCWKTTSGNVQEPTDLYNLVVRCGYSAKI